MLFEQQPYFVQRRYRASGYRRPCSSNVSSASRVGTLPSFFTAGRRLYGSWTVLQCWCSTSTLDSFSFLILALVCHAYLSCVCTPSSFPPKTLKSVRWFLVLFLRFAFLRLYGPYEREKKKTRKTNFFFFFSGKTRMEYKRRIRVANKR